MKEQIKEFICISCWMTVVLFAVLCSISMPLSLYEGFSCAGEVISITMIIMFIYEKWIWRLIPFAKTPKLYGRYTGQIEYTNNKGDVGKKDAEFTIKQSLLSINIKMCTDEICSNTITNSLVFENGEYVLYYTYLTSPKGKYSKKNPIQYGSARLMMSDKLNLSGTYWTSSRTIGDMYLTRSAKNENKH